MCFHSNCVLHIINIQHDYMIINTFYMTHFHKIDSLSTKINILLVDV